MKIVVLSSGKNFPGEIKIVTEMFKYGLEYFHLRKPTLSTADLTSYIKTIPIKYHSRIILHTKHNLAKIFDVKGIHLTSKHRKKKFKTWWNIKRIKIKNPNICITTSFHSIETLTENSLTYDYAFLSPVFDSISKRNYQGKFNENNLNFVFENLKTKVIALGGVDISKIEQIEEMGFDGMGLLGAIWGKDDPLAQFITIRKECEKRNLSLA